MKENSAAMVRKRDGRVVRFNEQLIRAAIAKAFLAQLNLGPDQSLDASWEREIELVTRAVADNLLAGGAGSGVGAEKIQEVVETKLLQFGHYAMARRFAAASRRTLVGAPS